ncbi:MAG TPA: Hsp20/alpha crystallin family protein [Thermoanaerobaculales bacterium]|nr:Hsp20/alpha crystallin family protein [Thermoanaerobaculales bacterium]HPA79783.1 Hsp20/alpha crystallin family protein [Thermoanaerobaculales bacterium]HQL29438.1 Hsp20/alpha crystallin family protein [Thermoanaerobaculales bacterium]HQN95530.1 Hsp20/alpha crystallin family protein [Thermoanaerobaculales bacterium]
MRTLTRWEPINDITSLSQRMDRVFEELMGRGLRRIGDEDRLRGSWSPAVNILEKKDAIVITADLPGLKAEDVEITVDNGVLTIRGERRLEEAADGETYHRVERVYGMFERTFTLPNSVDVNKIDAKFRNGEMVVTLPKREESKPRAVKVAIES